YGCNFNTIVRAAGSDDRVGMGHTRVPGFDGKRGCERGSSCLRATWENGATGDESPRYSPP
ncbi:MAG: hypothetical protein ACPH3M_09250, partial [Candidatus Puniceispirillales bacterium]